MKHKVYLETSVVSYLAAYRSKDPIIAGRQALTQEWWKTRKVAFELVASELVYQEAGEGDEEAAKRRMNYLHDIDSLELSGKTVSLAEALIKDGPIPEEYGEDALHIAVCAVNGIDFLLTWNCKHLANAVHRHQIETVVEKQGYRCPVICTPAELMEV